MRLVRSLAALLFCFPVAGFGQMAPWHHKTLLPDGLVDYFIAEASGEGAMRHIIEMAGYNRNRPAEEYRGTYFEAEYVLNQARSIGFDSVAIEYFEADSIWDGEEAELWEISPRRAKIADYDDLTAFLAVGSQSTDVTAELVYVGRGTSPEDYEDKDVRGKIVLGYGPAGMMHRLAVGRFEAVGVVSYASIHPLEDPDQIPWMGIYGRNAREGFAFNIGFRRGIELRDRLERGEKIVLRAHVRASRQPNRHNVVTAIIRGSELPDEYVIFSAHLFEGIAKQGANDNISGSACLLEIGRMLYELMQDGVIQRPRRSILFLWVPEFSGTIPWVDKHLDLVQRALVNINLDMEGAWLTKHGSFYNLERTPFSRPSYLNDVLQSLFEFVGETNRESLHGRRFTKPILAPSGSRDPFYYHIEYHYGASDHVVFNDWGVGVPGVMPITWPDLWYHSSGDRPDKLDPTQLKRAVFINGAAAFIIADADQELALRIAEEVFTNGMGRLGREHQRAVEMLNFAATSDLPEVYRRAENVMQVALDCERRTLLSVLELCPKDGILNRRVHELARTVTDVFGPSLLSNLWEHYRYICQKRGVPPKRPESTDLEKRAAKLVPKPTDKVRGYFRREWITESVEQSVRDSLMTISRQKQQELRRLIDGHRSALEIRNVLDAEFETPTDVQDVINYLRLLEKAGLVRM